MADEPFIELDTGKKRSVKDEHEIVRIDEKEVIVGNIGKIVAGDINSQEIEFSISRYYDNVDLLDKKFNILFKTQNGIFKVEAVNVSYNSQEIRFNWLMNEDATKYPGTIIAACQIEGTNDDGEYVMKTMNFSVNIQDSLCEYGIDGIYHTWATDIEERIGKLEGTSSTPFFIGTQNEYQEALFSGKITNGMFITLVDIDTE